MFLFKNLKPQVGLIEPRWENGYFVYLLCLSTHNKVKAISPIMTKLIWVSFYLPTYSIQEIECWFVKVFAGHSHCSNSWSNAKSTSLLGMSKQLAWGSLLMVSKTHCWISTLQPKWWQINIIVRYVSNMCTILVTLDLICISSHLPIFCYGGYALAFIS